MTAYSELKLRARAAAHDISDPVASADGALSTEVKTGKDVAERAVSRHTIHQPTAAGSAGAASDIGEKPILAVPASQYPNGAKIVEIGFRSDTAITASTSLYVTDTYVSRDKDGVNNLTAATMTTNTTGNGGIGTTVAQKRYAATLSGTLANLVVPPDGCLTLTRTHASTGTAMPDCLIDVTFEAL